MRFQLPAFGHYYIPPIQCLHSIIGLVTILKKHQGTEGTHAHPKNAHLDTIKAALSGLTRDELIHLLADMLAAKADGGGLRHTVRVTYDRN